jgi:hypothetical protein
MAAEDTARGTISVVGTSFDKKVMIAASTRRLEITGPQAALIGHLAGTEVVVRGTITERSIAATSFVVRSVDGQPAIDGVLHSRDGQLSITPAHGASVRIVNPPPPLAGREGARVWITGDPARAIASFGFIDPPR